MDLLDNASQIAERDSQNTLGLVADSYKQLTTDVSVKNLPKNLPEIRQVVLAGMGGSALAADMARDWLNLPLPFTVIKDYRLPQFVGPETLVIACSFSGNTEETLSALAEARSRNASVVVATGGGQLHELATRDELPFSLMEYSGQPRMNVLLNLQVIVEILIAYGLLGAATRDELKSAAESLASASQKWAPLVTFKDNPAKQLAWHCAGKTPVIYAGSRFRSVAYKWKIAFNETSKNMAFCNEYSEFNHNEFIGWSSHPVEKPFAVLDLRSSFDNPRVTQRFELSDRLLSGMRPKAVPLQLEGETMLEQFAWGNTLADYVSIYLAILNGVDPAPVALIEKLKQELAKS